jgi:glucose/arabinose dehydrogenase
MPRSPRFRFNAAASVVIAIAAACGGDGSPETPSSSGCDPLIKVPSGFCATVFADSVGPARELAVRKNGDVIVGVLDQRHQPGGVVALRDTNRDGRADVVQRFGEGGVHGVLLATDSVLYVSTASQVIRYRLGDDLTPSKHVDTLVSGLSFRPAPAPPAHTLAEDMRGNIVVNVAATTPGCAGGGAAPHVAAKDPCAALAVSGGIWSFHPLETNQTIADGDRLATGLYDAEALAVNPRDTMVYAVVHGRDQLHETWPELYTDAEAANAGAEELIRVQSSRADYGWPYCYYDFIKGDFVVAPEYGGAKQPGARCRWFIRPLLAFPAHWAPTSLLFYTGKMFPAAYRQGMFIAFHGSAYRDPLPEEGYDIVFVPLRPDGYAGESQVFAKGFAGPLMNPEGALHRPLGLAQGPDGALYISDDKGGRIWRVTYKP